MCLLSCCTSSVAFTGSAQLLLRSAQALFMVHCLSDRLRASKLESTNSHRISLLPLPVMVLVDLLGTLLGFHSQTRVDSCHMPWPSRVRDSFDGSLDTSSCFRVHRPLPLSLVTSSSAEVQRQAGAQRRAWRGAKIPWDEGRGGLVGQRAGTSHRRRRGQNTGPGLPRHLAEADP